MAGLREIPWPGPRPYEESEFEQFYGRSDEIEEICDRIASQKLTVLSGRSGTGKTSLLRAGVTPALRLQRFEEEGSTQWPVLLLRDWGAGRAATVRGLVGAALAEAVAAVAAWWTHGARAQDDFVLLLHAFADNQDEPDLLKLFEELVYCNEDTIEGLILVFDQLEEVLRLGSGAARETIDLIKQLHQSRLPVKIMLSLREEYLGELRGLERTVGGLMGRAVFLSPMARQTARDVVKAATAGAGYEIEEDAIKEIFTWLETERVGEEGGQDSQAGREDPDETTDLLTLQAILRELFTDFVDSERERAAIDIAALAEYRDRYGTESSSIVGGALIRWIAAAFPRPDRGDGDVEIEPSQRVAQRLAVRIAPHLSSAGYKLAQEESDLFAKAVGDDIGALGPTDVRWRGNLRLTGGRLNTETLGLSAAFDDAALEVLSGEALQNRWSKAQTAQTLADRFLEALKRLKGRNVVKQSFSWERKQGRDVPRWELVHDGLGRPFAEWAEQWKDTWDDCSASLVACRGLSPLRIDRVPRAPLVNARWEGCHIVPAAGTEVTLEGLDFTNCALRGSIFQHIRFRGCRFSETVLSGAVFLNCTFEEGEHGPVRFEHCRPESMAFIRCSFSGIEFHRCLLGQLTVARCALLTTSVFDGCIVTLGNFALLSRQRKEASLAFNANCSVSFCSGDEASWRLLSFAVDPIHSGPQELDERPDQSGRA